MLIWDKATGELMSREPDMLCSFGITEAIAAIGSFFAGIGGSIAGGIGLEGATLGGIGAGSLIGGGLEGAALGGLGGGVIDAVTGKPILQGIGEGALLGGVTGVAAPLVGAATGLGSVGADALTGAGVGAAGSAAFGGNPLTGALTGGAGGIVSGLLSGGGVGGAGGGPTSATGVGSGASAGAGATPAGASISPGSIISDAASPSTFGDTGGFGGGGSSSPTDLFTGATSSTSSTPGQSPFGDTQSLSSPLASPKIIPDVSNYEMGQLLGPTAPTPAAGFSSSLSGDVTSSPLTLGQHLGDLGNSLGISGPGGLFSSSGGGSSDIGSFLKSYGAPLVAAGGLGYEALKGSQPLPNQNALTAEASQLAGQGSQLQQYLATGTLPPGVQQSITQASDQAKAAIRSRYASLGGNTSAMQQDLSNVDQVAATQGSQIATQLLQEGVQETGLSEQIYSQLLNLAVSQNAALGSSVGSLAVALAGQPGVLKVQAAT